MYMRVVLLCGGKGTRLSEETRVTPKPLVEIGGIPIVSHIINQFLDFGFSDFILATGYKSENFEEYFSSENSTRLARDFNGRNPFISIENTGLETLTGGRVLRLKELLSKEDKFMLTYGDGVSNVDLLKLQDFHNTHGRIASVTAVRPPARFGVIRIDDQSRVEYFQEKNQTEAGWINGGFFVLNKDIFNYLIDDQTILEDYPLRTLTSVGQLMAYKHQNFWQCMDTLRDREYLEELWKTGKAPWK
jgi:glucose-1-phosphate cytidylyltransferase